ncbi:hypothetical protein BD310DRAFT_923298 [Dichomitus squalens]|uniref:Uncharacterized protein n=1 Tax=Dichomitus squalens TaxID=114155 RepID=A0A4V2K8K3_9APHY|nr:hypothetical protein BD310DRAFT_923298 [Dichomitus squalens]
MSAPGTRQTTIQLQLRETCGARWMRLWMPEPSLTNTRGRVSDRFIFVRVGCALGPAGIPALNPKLSERYPVRGYTVDWE